MTKAELRKLHIINCALEHKCTVADAAKALDLSERRIKQLKKGVKEHGIEFVIHGNRGRKPAHAIDDDLVQKIIELRKSFNYQDSNFLHFKELIEDYEHIKISYSALHNILNNANITSPKKHRIQKKHPRRARKPAAGMMLQADGTPHDWFGNGKNFSLHGFIDDATNNITGLYMCEHECLLGYLEVTRQTLTNFGIPMSIYPDKYSVFFPPKNQETKLTIEEQLSGVKKSTTQFGRIMDELGIEMFPASSPQAKGRIERLWGTLQSRLVTEFRINGITTIELANKFLPDYITKYNKKFSVNPEQQETAFIPLPEKIDLDSMLCVKLQRTTDNAGIFSINNCKFAVNDKSIPPRAKITVLISKDAGIRAMYKNVMYDVSNVDFLEKETQISQYRKVSLVALRLIHEFFLKDVKAS